MGGSREPHSCCAKGPTGICGCRGPERGKTDEQGTQPGELEGVCWPPGSPPCGDRAPCRAFAPSPSSCWKGGSHPCLTVTLRLQVAEEDRQGWSQVTVSSPSFALEGQASLVHSAPAPGLAWESTAGSCGPQAPRIPQGRSLGAVKSKGWCPQQAPEGPKVHELWFRGHRAVWAKEQRSCGTKNPQTPAEHRRLRGPSGRAGLATTVQDPLGLEFWGPEVPKSRVSQGRVRELTRD